MLTIFVIGIGNFINLLSKSYVTLAICSVYWAAHKAILPKNVHGNKRSQVIPCIRWVQNPTCKLQSHCNEVTALTGLLMQFYSFAIPLKHSFREWNTIKPHLQEKRKKEQRSKVRKGNLVIFLITAQFLVWNHSSRSFILAVFLRTGSVSQGRDTNPLRQDLYLPRMIFSDTLGALSQS